jgi:hypothetical protein
MTKFFTWAALSLLPVMLVLIFLNVVTTKNSVALLGLCWDIVGAFLLGGGLLSRHMAVYRIGGKDYSIREQAYPADWLSRIALNFAFCFGSKDARATQSFSIDEYVTTFFGMLLLAFGFVLQALSQFL